MDQITPAAQAISPEERERRIEQVNYARGSVRLEGFIISPAAEALYQRYIDGHLTSSEVTAAIRAMHVE